MNWRRDWYWYVAAILAVVLVWWLWRGNWISSAWSGIKGALFTRGGDNTGAAAAGSGTGESTPAVAATSGPGNPAQPCAGGCC